ncbi:GDP-mannose 4,6-dehydratase [Synechococcus sp. BA-132 BA5]|uniref:GDP-mannose 4,6-dehydratase n=1 Tax=Synechococcus sp. BA-132 BA5 TaxID=3110252 RepID=UPI002B1FC0D4|nr:GDP-mannose 4,6-dehydratase [Synechococcus sp. BA-132 BA5]MEA5415575.1 GDP-mannose 4,6-dehydratase [Synechococcus sp. BA-132 BA5]
MLSPDTLIGNRHRILVNGGAVFRVGAVMRRSLSDSVGLVFSRNKCGYASDLTSIEKVLQELGQHGESRHRLFRVDLADAHAAAAAVQQANPDLVLHLGTESDSQDDRSNKCPGACIKSDITGTFSLLQAERVSWEGLPARRRELNRIHNISTDEVLCSLGATGRFSETTTNTLYDPRSLYSPSKTCSDHLVQDWHQTYGLPVVMTNCSNNYGSWQFLKKLSPVVILEAAAREPIRPYGDAQNAHDWLYVVENLIGFCWRPPRISWGTAIAWEAMGSAPTSRWWR